MNKQLSVSALNDYIKGVFEDELVLHNLAVFGEVAEVSFRKGSTFLTLSEGDCTLSCTNFASVDNLKKGDRVTLFGGVRFYRKRGTVTFTYRDYKVEGKGDKHERLKKLFQQISADGTLEKRAKMPKYVFSVAVITSKDGAAVHDFLSVLASKSNGIAVQVYDSLMQGDGAADSVIQALALANEQSPNLIVLTRGGGSDVDLDVFNTERLARAVAESTSPVLSAVGHEIDYTLCDICASARAGTPSIAADITARLNIAYTQDLARAIVRIDNHYTARSSSLNTKTERGINRLLSALSRTTSVKKMQIDSLMRAMIREASISASERYRAFYASLNALNGTVETDIERKDAKLRSICEVFHAHDPMKKIAKGYAQITSKGAPIISTKSVAVGDEIDIKLPDGAIEANVVKIIKQ